MQTKVLFVCLGNICRSPMAEAVFRDIVEKENLNASFLIDSAGTANYHIGKSPDHRTIKICQNHGINIEHKCKQIKESDLSFYDYIIAMDLQNLTNIKKTIHHPDQNEKIYLMRNFSEPDQNLEVPDPYYGNLNDFEEVYKILSKSCKALFDKIIK